ncbi:thiamine-binding protein [uncultured Bifidobacterium sp.]|uniref:thiamine-binding protein n=1 Tax=uncultured Bifidobacterium sp. TaxID=165187 RepID=UPI0025904421|nr:thiamine-binding protein [uncultured Bifidobacterium sp.]
MHTTTATTSPDRNAVRQDVPTDEHGAPIINTVAAVAIAPSGVGAELSDYVAEAVAVIRDSGLPNETNAMFTNIEGNLDDVLRVVRDATMKLAGQGYRTGVSLKLDIRPGFSGQMAQKPALVDEIIAGRGRD